MAFIRGESKPAVPGGERRTPPDGVTLIEELEDANPMVRRRAARALGACAEAADVMAASAALVRRLPFEANASVREFMLHSLTSLGDKTALAGLVECLRSEDVALRNEAIEALQRLPEQVAPLMDALLDDESPDVRIFAVNVLESLRHPDVEWWLIGVIERDPHLNVCATAVDLLGEVGSAASREPLLRLKQRFAGERYIQFAADLALSRISVG